MANEPIENPVINSVCDGTAATLTQEVFAFWLKEHYQTIITDLLAAQLGFAPQLEFVVNAPGG